VTAAVMQTQTRLFLMLAEETGFDRYSTNNKATVLGLKTIAEYGKSNLLTCDFKA